MDTEARPSEDASLEEPLLADALLEGLESESAEALLLIGELRGLTGWDQNVLLSRLGCDPKRTRSSASAEAQMAHSLAFLKWVVALARQLDRKADARDTVIGAYELCHDAGGAVAERVTRCEDAMRALHQGVNGDDLIALGEIAPAFNLAARALGSGPAYDRAMRLAEMTDDLDATTGHLHAARLRWLGADDKTRATHLGLAVAVRMAAHLNACTRCARVASQLGVHGGPQDTRARAA